MTYSSTQQFELTALIGAEILAPGNNELGRGDTFEMPASASASIVVTDNDGTLSGDACRNESGDDRTGQAADITIDGQTVAEDVRIYAEEYYTVRDQNGRTTS